jgi:hypothetical protein
VAHEEGDRCARSGSIFWEGAIGLRKRLGVSPAECSCRHDSLIGRNGSVERNGAKLHIAAATCGCRLGSVGDAKGVQCVTSTECASSGRPKAS